MNYIMHLIKLLNLHLLYYVQTKNLLQQYDHDNFDHININLLFIALNSYKHICLDYFI